MIKNKFNSKLREYAKTLSPKQTERDLINNIYESFNDLCGVVNCIQIGSYPRFTATTPVHDLDILYVIGIWDENNHTPSMALQSVFNKIISQYKNPTYYKVKATLQTHSVTIEFFSASGMALSVDIVPAYSYGKNEFDQNKYKVPEVIKERDHLLRKALTWDASDNSSWIDSDPRGYIKVASEVGQNPDFRKTVKFIKRWKNNLCDADNTLKLKSFHLEQVVTKMFQRDQNMDIFDAIFEFFCDLPNVVKTPNQILDRVNNTKYIDDYLASLTKEQIEKIIKARDGFLIKLEKLKETDTVSSLMEIVFYSRPPSEEFMFDRRIKTLIDDTILFKIDGFVKPLEGFSSGWLTQTPQLQRGLTRGQNKTRYIEFSVTRKTVNTHSFLWKVRNSDSSGNPRGEITPNQTRNNPERTEYPGDHYVECHAVNGDCCVAKARLSVKII